jgi:hypothetical protein
MPGSQPGREGALARLEALTGEWEEQVTPPGAAPMPARGRTIFEWALGGQFLLERSAWQHPDFPDSLAIIAVAPDGESYTRHYFDSRGVARVYAMSLSSRAWTLTRDTPDFSPLHFAQRFTATIATDGTTIDGTWETADDGQRWEHDFRLTYTRLA